MIRTVAVPVLDDVLPFELGVLCEVFGTPRPDDPELPTFEFTLCTGRPGPVRAVSGYSLIVDRGWDALDDADLIAVPALRLREETPPELLEKLAAAHRRGAWLLSVCTGSFLLGQAGILDGRECTTHWMHVDELRELVPSAKVDADVLYVEDGNVLTSAGTAAGIDASLHLIRREFGTRVANRLARRMVMPPHREGGQRQYVDQPVPCEVDTLSETLQWMLENLAEDMTVDELADRAHLSSRTFARRFRAETGTTPLQWLTDQRILHARRLLEETAQPVEKVADLVGFGSASVLRHHFTRRVGTTPHAYRRTFARAG
ncbi:MAG TPA: helix-turn-helix domain-containing protein [Actinomycetes bacterium]